VVHLEISSAPAHEKDEVIVTKPTLCVNLAQTQVLRWFAVVAAGSLGLISHPNGMNEGNVFDAVA
jgi:hypothetical protein